MLPKLPEEFEDIRGTNDDVVGTDTAAENERFLSAAPPVVGFDGINGKRALARDKCFIQWLRESRARLPQGLKLSRVINYGL